MGKKERLRQRRAEKEAERKAANLRERERQRNSGSETLRRIISESELEDQGEKDHTRADRRKEKREAKSRWEEGTNLIDRQQYTGGSEMGR